MEALLLGSRNACALSRAARGDASRVAGELHRKYYSANA